MKHHNFSLPLLLILALFSTNQLQAKEKEICPDLSNLSIEKSISLDLQDTEIDNFFKLISQITSYNVVGINVPKKRITLLVKDKNYKDILKQVSKENNLSYQINGNVIAFFSDTDPARLKVSEHKDYSGSCVSLDFQETKLSNTIKILESVSGKKIKNVPTESAKKKVSMKVLDVPWQQAIDLILLHAGLKGKRPVKHTAQNSILYPR